ncbi:MAG: chlorophyll synthase ChlG [Chlorobium sp.]|nr:MAG: chlorophyll synthase ChlG [Chlorobium sp.]
MLFSYRHFFSNLKYAQVIDFRSIKDPEGHSNPDSGEFKTPLNVRKLVQARSMPVENMSKIALIVRFLKPVTWIPVMWSFLCGAVASGAFGWKDVFGVKFILGMLLTGPLASGTCQMLNDYFDRDLDEINEPNRPIPGGAMSLKNATILITVWSILSVITGYLINPLIGLYVVIGIVNAHLYSANPIKLKKRLWAGNIIVAISYLMIPWIAGEIAFSQAFSLQTLEPSLIVAGLFTLSSTGTMTINDFKSIEGDRQIGIRTLPVVFGEKNAAIVASVLINIGQLLASCYMFLIDQPLFGLIVGLLVIPQFFMQFALVRSPSTMDIKYNAIAQNFLVAGMLLCAFAIKAHRL